MLRDLKPFGAQIERGMHSENRVIVGGKTIEERPAKEFLAVPGAPI